MKKHLLKVGVGAGAMLVAGSSFAVSIVDYSAVATTLTTELTSAITAGLPIAGTILGVAVGFKMYKRFTH